MMKKFWIVCVLMAFNPIIWWGLYIIFETPKGENLGLCIATNLGFITSEVVLAMILLLLVQNNKEVQKFFM